MTLFLVSVAAFLAFQIIPGDVVTSILGTEATPERGASLVVGTPGPEHTQRNGYRNDHHKSQGYVFYPVYVQDMSTVYFFE